MLVACLFVVHMRWWPREFVFGIPHSLLLRANFLPLLRVCMHTTRITISGLALNMITKQQYNHPCQGLVSGPCCRYIYKHIVGEVNSAHQELRARKCTALPFLAVAFALFLSHSLLPSIDFQWSTDCNQVADAQSLVLLWSPCNVQWRWYTALFLLYKCCRNPATMPSGRGFSIINCLFISDMISSIVDGFLMSISAFGTIARAASFRAFKNCVLYWTMCPVSSCWSQNCGTLPSAIDFFTSFK